MHQNYKEIFEFLKMNEFMRSLTLKEANKILNQIIFKIF